MDLNELIQLDETRIDKTAVLQRIAAQLAARDWAVDVSFPTFVLAAPDDAAGRFSPELHARLQALLRSSDQVWVEEEAAAGQSVLGRAAAALKRPFHQLAVYYVNKLGARQTAVNDDVRRLLHQLVREAAQPDPRVARLEAEVAALQAEIARMKAERDGADA